MDNELYGCIEAGGTKFVCAIATGPDDIRAQLRIPTTTPEETLGRAVQFFREQAPVEAFGIASFGPVDLDPVSPSWGRICKTPKPGWSGADIAGAFAEFGRPVGFDTDVNGAILGEARWGAARGCDTAVYFTIGTGIGGGAIVGGAPIHGRGHPEMGHGRPPRHADDYFAGACPFHGDCYEGMASGPAILARWGQSLSELPQDHPAHEIEAFYIAHLCVSTVAMLAPQRIVLGGGVMGTPGLLDRVRVAAEAIGGGYFGEIAPLIVPTGLGERSGIAGALVLAEHARHAIARAC
ncbi:fructokinase [Sphingomonas oleivorans]|uniref:fructokinase n=1 Tax=Sphingomonas oleivorans TaxID=1735121 RepID=A0A2T5FWY3_9SPHN|nr:ROK family protein [Sphingomonas oleivorans]PTQ10300.1 fructokinase [Sphingomonas oleivorans]